RPSVSRRDERLGSAPISRRRGQITQPLPEGFSLRRSHLLSARWLLGPPETAIRALVVEAFRSEGLEPPRVAVSTHNMELRMQLLARSDYVTSLPASLLQANGKRWGLRALPIRLRPPVPVVVATLRRRRLIAPVELFLTHLRAVTAELNGTAINQPG
ncbi:hypothetical protein E2C06_33785, partial [Dankookia rubra]